MNASFYMPTRVFFGENALFNNKKSKCNPEIALTILKDLFALYSNQESWTPEAITQLVTDYAQQHEMKLGLPMWALRIAVSGTAVTPGGPGEIMTVLGKAESLRRMELAINRLA
jgi:glutamyl-tRNA synthetase